MSKDVPLPDTAPVTTGLTAPGLSRNDLHGSVVGVLRELIVSGVLSPGARLDESELAKTLGLSRTPLREAIKVLAAEQFLSIVPRRGAYVAPLLPASTAELFEVMATLDALVGRAAAARATTAERERIALLHIELARHHHAHDDILYFQVNQDIHRALLEATHMAALINTYAPLLHRVQRARMLANVSLERQAESLAEHERILEAFLDRDEAALAMLLAAHTRATGRAVLAAMEGGA